ncbi:uncharacterized protein [Elaeis guineensis]|uniref:uncharacterized protein isoform X2 n=1 Tax=Elaeis guineensis var. tenera TaxID=51953 RepID=UPI003C6DB703
MGAIELLGCMKAWVQKGFRDQRTTHGRGLVVCGNLARCGTHCVKAKRHVKHCDVEKESVKDSSLCPIKGGPCGCENRTQEGKKSCEKTVSHQKERGKGKKRGLEGASFNKRRLESIDWRSSLNLGGGFFWRYVDISAINGATSKLIYKHIKDTGASFLEVMHLYMKQWHHS